ncbi:hypothetical protein [Selenomonas noxia]
MSSEFQFERRIDAKLLLSLLAAGLMSFTGVVIETAMNVTFPTLMQEFDIGISVVQWITTGYLLMLAVIIPLSAFLKARYAMRRLFFTASARCWEHSRTVSPCCSSGACCKVWERALPSLSCSILYSSRHRSTVRE